MHPHDASGFDAEAAARIEEMLGDPRVIGVGECGLDYFRMHSPEADQIRTLRTHIGWSKETGKPMVVHVRDAWRDVLRVLDEGSAEHVVIHCFSGDADIARECVARGYFTSFAGSVVPEERASAQAAAAVPLDRLLVRPTRVLSPQKNAGPTTPRTCITLASLRASARQWKPSPRPRESRAAFPACGEIHQNHPEAATSNIRSFSRLQ
jgi:TatD DNase family protein